LGNKDLSQLGAFVFLAIWHGYHFNYFHTFALEFSFIFVERLIRKRIYFPIVQPLFSEHKHALWLWKAIAWLSTSFCFNYAIVGFDLLTFRRGVKAYNSIYWLGHLGVIAVIVGYVSLGNPKKHHKSS
jgi:lysophospholipid acyltransferase 5